ncbi:MAG: 2-C-methyl-D-erythritol 4-phosphate cytidylyltransferase [Acidobacteriota bacterium]|nr:2-C-methyl-D-erythritol 4-phosphate cytidylyltransferase [Acidobacteriota bacterium]MDH3529082.1 2-C-methyl-D-erythritol 4-phosphate cytidylyltransferase [Acidobacteriota bacterium]
MNAAIIVAAGDGKRFGGTTPKQFLTLRGKTLLEIAVSRFEECADILEVVVVVPADFVDRSMEIIRKFPKTAAVVAGGTTRSGSVLNGLNAAAGAGIIAVHDGARPLVTVEEISRTVRAADEFGAACLAVPVTDTIKKTDGQEIITTVDRSTLRRAVTPQCFRREILERAFAEAESMESATDECTLVERLGIPVRLVEGSARNIKITMPDDLVLAEALLGARFDETT